MLSHLLQRLQHRLTRVTQFPFLVFTMFGMSLSASLSLTSVLTLTGSFYASYGATLIPWFNTYASFSEYVYADPQAGLSSQGFNAGYGESSGS